MKITKDCVEHRFMLEGADPVEKLMGNGLRRIIPVEARVTCYSSGTWYVYLGGRQLLRSGERGRWSGVTWSVGGDGSGDAPDLVHRLIAEATR